MMNISFQMPWFYKDITVIYLANEETAYGFVKDKSIIFLMNPPDKQLKEETECGA